MSQKSQTVVLANPPQNSTLKRQYQHIDNAHRYSYFDMNLYGTVGPKSFQNTVIVGVGGGAESFDNRRWGFGGTLLSSASVTFLNPVVGVTPWAPDGTSPQDTKNYITAFGAYISDLIKFGDRWHLTLGSRRDQQNAHGIDAINPTKTPYAHALVSATVSQVGAIYDFTKVVSGYVAWSQSFVPATITNADANGNYGFPPQKGEQWEGGIKLETPDHKLFLSMATYYITRTNVAVATNTVTANNIPIFRLDGAQHSEGAELEMEWQPLPNWQFQGGVAVGKAFVASSIKNPTTVGLYLANAPTKTATLWNRYNIPHGPLKGLGFGLGIINVGSEWNGDPTTASYFPIAGWTRFDGDMYYQWHRYKFSLDVRNVFDRQYIQIAQNALQMYPGDPRKLTITVSTHF